jgi:hypothetical protein
MAESRDGGSPPSSENHHQSVMTVQSVDGAS